MSLPHTENEAIALIRKAVDAGINYFDTADVYNGGQNEALVGKALQSDRSNMVIATKVGNVPKADGSGGFDWNPSREHILASVEESLRRLNTDYIDLYQLHGGTIDDNIDETIEAFELLKKQGKIRYYGISSIRPNVISEYVKRSDIVSVMMQYSLIDRRPEEKMLDLLEQNNISVLVRGAVAQGLLAGKPPRPYLSLREEEVAKAASLVNTQTAIRYVFSHPAVASAVMGMRTEEHLSDALRATELPDLSRKQFIQLQASVRPLIYTDHRN